jgi:hypothetical protein
MRRNVSTALVYAHPELIRVVLRHHLRVLVIPPRDNHVAQPTPRLVRAAPAVAGGKIDGDRQYKSCAIAQCVRTQIAQGCPELRDLAQRFG